MEIHIATCIRNFLPANTGLVEPALAGAIAGNPVDGLALGIHCITVAVSFWFLGGNGFGTVGIYCAV